MRRLDLAVAGSATAALGSYLAVRCGASACIDAPAHRVLTGHHGPRTDRTIAVLTDLGSVYALLGVATSCFLTGRRRAALDIAAAGLTAWVAAQSTKPLMDRARPYELQDTVRLIAAPVGSSWPSGHAALSAAMADAAGARAGRPPQVLLGLVTVGVGLSRCYVGVHHLTDVVAGVGVGILSSRLARRTIVRLARRRPEVPPVRPPIRQPWTEAIRRR